MRRHPSKQNPKHNKTGSQPDRKRRERQIVRVLALLRMLASGRRLSVHELAAAFQTRRETIYRDLRVLQDAGYPIAGDERGRLSRPRLLESQTSDLRFSQPEIDALLMAVSQTKIALPNTEALASAALKLKVLAATAHDSVLPAGSQILETWGCGVKDFQSHESRIVLIIEAILRKRTCRVEYRKPANSESKHYDFEPYRLLFVEGGLYIIGRVPKHGGTATLSVDRIQSLVLTEAEFEVDPDFDPRQCRGDAFGVSWQDPREIILRFRADQAPYVRERLWHPSQQLTHLPDGGVQLCFRAGGPFEIRRWILGWGDAVQVISPDELRDEIRGMLSRSLAVYGC